MSLSRTAVYSLSHRWRLYVAPDFNSRRARRGGDSAGCIGLFIQCHRPGPGQGGPDLRLSERQHLPSLADRSVGETRQGARHLVEGRRPGWGISEVFTLQQCRVTRTQSRRNSFDPEFEFVQTMTAGDL